MPSLLTKDSCDLRVWKLFQPVCASVNVTDCKHGMQTLSEHHFKANLHTETNSPPWDSFIYCVQTGHWRGSCRDRD